MILTRPENCPYPDVQWTAIMESKSGSCYQDYINRLPIMGHGATKAEAVAAVEKQIADLIKELQALKDA